MQISRYKSEFPLCGGAQEIVDVDTILNANALAYTTDIGVNFVICERCIGDVSCTLQHCNQGIDKYRCGCTCNFAVTVRKDLFFSKPFGLAILTIKRFKIYSAQEFFLNNNN